MSKYPNFHREAVEARKDPIVRQCVFADADGDTALVYHTMADRAEELGLMDAAAVWRLCAHSFAWADHRKKEMSSDD